MRKDIVRLDHEEEDAVRVKGWDYQNWLKKENRKTSNQEEISRLG